MSPPPPDALSQSIDHTSAAVSTAAAGDEWPWYFARCWMHLDRFDHHGRTPADLEAARADFARLPTEAPGRARLASVLLDVQVRSAHMEQPGQIERMVALAEVAGGDPAPLPQWPLNRSLVRAFSLVVALQQGLAGVSARSALAEIDQLIEAVSGAEPYTTAIRSVRVGVASLVAQQDGDLSAQARITKDTEDLQPTIVPETPMQVQHRVLITMQTAQEALARGDLTTAIAEFDRAVALRGDLPVGSPLVAALDEAASSMQAIRHMMGGGPGGTAAAGRVPSSSAADTTRASPTEAIAASLDELRRRAARIDLSPAQRAMNLAELAVAELAAAEEAHDPTHVDAAVEHLREAVALSPVHDPNRTYYLMSCGGALVRRYEIWNANGQGAAHRRDLGDAVDVLEEAQQVSGGPAHPYWSTLCQILADAYRYSGHAGRSRDTGRDGLRGHAWSVLLQSRTGAATAAARNAAGEAIDLARRYLADNDPAGAATALDAGRGLVLRAAVQFSDLPGRLTLLGYPDLARRWRDAVGDGDVEKAPIALRREAVERLAAARPPGAAALRGSAVDPPTPHEIRAALTTLGADALVYLVPGDTDGAGVAVVVPATDEPSWLALPQLDPRTATALDDYLVQGASRDATWARLRDMGAPDMGGPAEAEPTTWRNSLDTVCDWAWAAAMGPLLTHLPRHHDLPGDRPPRLVLVPMGPLARVPWHAAHDRHRGHAVQRAVFSYAVSARMLCDSAWAQPLPVTPSGLVIGDPSTGRATDDLPAARVEALAVRDTFYRRARYVGRGADGTTAADGAGNWAQVQRWLADTGTYAGSVLHAACHGTVRPATDDDATSYLLLANGDALAAEVLVHTLITNPTRGLALVVLAACSSGVPSRGYDEAFSLATAFLAGGTRSVVSALWRIPDADTSVLMFMFHHFLRELPPVDALREAQLWMLRPDRRPPVTMPGPLRAELSRADPTGIAAWAGFVHAGR